MTRARTLGRLLATGAAAVTVAALGLAAPPASAAPAGHAAKPAPVDPSAVGRSRAPRAAAAAPATSTHTVPNELLRQTLAEGDADAQPEPNISALCQDTIGQLNVYNPVAPNVDAINHDTTVTVGSQTGCQAAQNETSIAVNPVNPNAIVAGANDYRVFVNREGRNDSTGWAYASRDGGRTWTDTQVPGLVQQTGATGALRAMDAAGDPAVAWGPNNTVYYANLVFSRAAPAPGGTEGASGMVVSVSHDGGFTWDQPTILTIDGANPDGTFAPTRFFNDKEWIAVDPFRGTVYVSWTKFTDNPDGSYLESPIVVVKSTDGGRHFTAPTRVSPSLAGFTGGITPFAQGSNPAVQNDGTLQIAYETSVCANVNCDQAADHDATVVATSRDGGRTFRTTEVALNFDFPTNEDVGRATLTGENFRLNSYPQLTVDRFTNRLWVTWADNRNGQYNGSTSVKTNGDALVTSSANGRDWTPLKTVGTAADEVFPAVAALGGRVAVTYYTRTYDPHGIGLDYAYQAGWGDRVATGRAHRITTQTSNPGVQFVGIGLMSGQVLQGVFIGDYSAVAVGLDFRIHPCWTDFRGNPGTTSPNQDAMSQSISLFQD